MGKILLAPKMVVKTTFQDILVIIVFPDKVCMVYIRRLAKSIYQLGNGV